MLYWTAFLCIFLVGSTVSKDGKDSYKIQSSCSQTAVLPIQYLHCSNALNKFSKHNGVISYNYGDNQSCNTCKVTLSLPYGRTQISHPSIRAKAVDDAIMKGLADCPKQNVNATIVFGSGNSLSVLLDHTSGPNCPT